MRRPRLHYLGRKPSPPDDAVRLQSRAWLHFAHVELQKMGKGSSVDGNNIDGHQEDGIVRSLMINSVPLGGIRLLCLDWERGT